MFVMVARIVSGSPRPPHGCERTHEAGPVRVRVWIRQHGGVTSLDVTIGGEGDDSITITILGRMHPGATDYWDGNWLLSPTTISVGDFTGRIGGGLRCDELQQFRVELESLNATLSGAAQLSSMEGWVDVRMIGDGLGHVAVSGSLMDEPGVGNRLEFTFDIDQTFLPGIIKSLVDVAQSFPVLGSPR